MNAQDIAVILGAATPALIGVFANYVKLAELNKTAGEIHVMVNGNMSILTAKLDAAVVALAAQTKAAAGAATIAAATIADQSEQIRHPLSGEIPHAKPS